AAHDLGFLTVDQLVERIEATMATLGRLERFEGHLLNWYDTRTGVPLRPRYVSTVDSGNLLACLWTLAEGLRELVSRPVIGSAALRGLGDALALMQELPATRLPASAWSHRGEADRVEGLIRRLGELFSSPPEQAAEIVRRLRAAE